MSLKNLGMSGIISLFENVENILKTNAQSSLSWKINEFSEVS